MAQQAGLLLQAKASFFECLDGSSPDQNKRCSGLRASFEKECPASWVRLQLTATANAPYPKQCSTFRPCTQVQHFDNVHSQQTKVIRALQTNINQSSGAAAGQLAGKA